MRSSGITICWKAENVDRSKYGHEQDTFITCSVWPMLIELPLVPYDAVCVQA